MLNIKEPWCERIKIFSVLWKRLLLVLMTGMVNTYLSNMLTYQIRIGQLDETLEIYSSWARSAFMIALYMFNEPLWTDKENKFGRILSVAMQVAAIYYFIQPFLWNFNILHYSLFK